MRWLKCLMWASFVQSACLGRFISIFYVDIGLTESHIGILFGLQRLIFFVATPIWGLFADKTKNRYLAFQISIIGSGLTSLLLIVPYYLLKIQNNISLLFISMLIVFAIFNLFSNVICSLQDALILLNIEDRKQYGEIRKYGAISWGITHIIIGILLDWIMDIEWTVILSTALTAHPALTRTV